MIVRWDGSEVDGLAGLLAGYHLQTEAEKGAAVSDVDHLPDHYRAEILDPGTAFGDDTVLLAMNGDKAVGCVVVTGRSEMKRLWTDPECRGQGIGTELVKAALDQSAGTVRLSVWKWRTGAIALYERLGFAVTQSWDERDHMVCMEYYPCHIDTL